MNTTSNISGIHHITAIASSARENLAFYEQVLGLRLVKKTVNFDDPYTYHLYYGDSNGSPGTILTFFPWEKLPQGKTGAGMVTTVGFSIPTDSFEYWQKRLITHGIATEETRHFGDRVIRFEDPHGLPLELIGISTGQANAVWKDSPVPLRHGIIGFHSATALLNSLEETRRLLMDHMGMKLHVSEHNRYRFKMTGEDSLGIFYDVLIDDQAQRGRQGGGTFHHIAFRAKTFDDQKYWQRMLKENDYSVTSIIDRKYFKSIYFHEPGGVLFEIATDSPGFTVDEPEERLGRDLKLPDQYEPIRADIESRLPTLQPVDIDDGFIIENQSNGAKLPLE